MPQLTTLGTLTLRVDGTDCLSGRRKVLALLAYLAQSPGPVPRDLLASLFWPCREAERARHSLRQALSELRNAVGAVLVVGQNEVGVGHGLEADTAALAAAAEADDATRVRALWAGDFLAGLDDLGGTAWMNWLAGERSRLRALRDRAAGPSPAVVPSPGPVQATRQPAPSSITAAPRWAAGHEPATVFTPTREITVGLLGTLSTEARSALEAAAVLGDEVTEAHLAALASLRGRTLASALEELGERRMLLPSAQGWHFSSPGARHRVLAMISGDRRRQLAAAAERMLGEPVGLESATTAAAPSGGRRLVTLLLGSVTLLAALTVALPRP